MRLHLTKTSAVFVMVLVTFLWGTAGVVTRHLHFAGGFEITFWRAVSCALTLLAFQGLLPKGASNANLWHQLRHAGRLFWSSALCWAVMFTAFMLALSMAPVGNVLVTMACGPLLTALIARLALGHAIPHRTWLAIFVAGFGIAAMYLQQVGAAGWVGTAVAFCVPIAGAVNWNLSQYGHEHGEDIDLLPAVMAGAVASSLITLPLAFPLRADGHDIALLMGLGIFQLALPCALCVACSRVLKAPQMSLLQLLEVVFGILLAWLGASETPTATVLSGGALVLGALFANEYAGLKARIPA